MQRKILVATAAACAVFSYGLLGWALHGIGYRAGAEASTAALKATCDDPIAPTQLSGTTYMCLSKPQWNEVLERVFQQGAVLGYRRGRGEV